LALVRIARIVGIAKIEIGLRYFGLLDENAEQQRVTIDNTTATEKSPARWEIRKNK
jgi:hypothetical protein